MLPLWPTFAENVRNLTFCFELVTFALGMKIQNFMISVLFHVHFTCCILSIAFSLSYFVRPNLRTSFPKLETRA